MAGRSREWIQVNASLARPGGSALPSARALFRELDAALPGWRRQGLVSHCFFQRKPPDLRLRLRGSGDLNAPLRALLSRVRSDGHLIKVGFSPYEPEERQFGGRACMGHVHAYWSLDSRLWTKLDRLIEVQALRSPHATVMAAVFNDLFWRALGDGGEAWDSWCNLLVLLQGCDAHDEVVAEPPFLESLLEPGSEAEAAILICYRQANARLAAGLLDAWSRGRLSCGLRTILPHVAMFTLNRHGFDREAATALARAMAAAWNPKVALRGGRPDGARVGRSLADRVAMPRLAVPDAG